MSIEPAILALHTAPSPSGVSARSSTLSRSNFDKPPPNTSWSTTAGRHPAWLEVLRFRARREAGAPWKHLRCGATATCKSINADGSGSEVGARRPEARGRTTVTARGCSRANHQTVPIASRGDVSARIVIRSSCAITRGECPSNAERQQGEQNRLAFYQRRTLPI